VIRAGDGWQYLMEQVTRGAEDYYLADIALQPVIVAWTSGAITQLERHYICHGDQFPFNERRQGLVDRGVVEAGQCTGVSEVPSYRHASRITEVSAASLTALLRSRSRPRRSRSLTPACRSAPSMVSSTPSVPRACFAAAGRCTTTSVTPAAP
jgi:hypothetical protein